MKEFEITLADGSIHIEEAKDILAAYKLFKNVISIALVEEEVQLEFKISEWRLIKNILINYNRKNNYPVIEEIIKNINYNSTY